LAAVVKDKSEDLAIFHESLSRIICQEDCAEAVRKIADIHNTQVRDSAIRMALPVLLFRKETIDTFPGIISAGSLREIVTCLVEGKMDGILAESVSFENGVEIHNFTINKKLAFEEAWLTKQLAVLILFDKRLRNIYCIMEDVQKGTETWLTEILIADRKIEKYTGEYLSEDNVSGLSKLLESLQRNVGIYNRLCGCIRAFYYSVLVKIYLLLNRVEDAEKNIPDELKSYRPLSDYVLAIKNEKNEIDIEDLYEYSVRNETYWLINNYFVVRQSATELISFCKEHEELFEKDIPLFFMYIGALNASGLQEERKTQLDKQSDKLRFIYEYWNEMLDLDPSEQVQKDFVAACRDGKMSGMVSSSEYLMIERLLYLREYDIANIYLKKHEKTGESNYRIKKYKAIILQGKKNDVEALKWFKASFAENSKDVYVIDSLITLSLMNKRTVDKAVIDAAIESNTSRLHMLV